MGKIIVTNNLTSTETIVMESISTTLELTEEQKEQAYKDLVVSLIRKKYSADDELAINRQRDAKPIEFEEYNAFCEQCKQQAKQVLNIT